MAQPGEKPLENRFRRGVRIILLGKTGLWKEDRMRKVGVALGTQKEYKAILKKHLNREVLLSSKIPLRSKIKLVRRTPIDEEEILVKFLQESLGEPNKRGLSHWSYIATIYNLCLRQADLEPGMGPA